MNNTNKNGNCKTIGETISRQWPPIERNNLMTRIRKFQFNIFSQNTNDLDAITMLAPMPQQAATARILKTAEPTIVPIPMSPSVINVPITLTNNSGLLVAPAINVAPQMSLDIFNATKIEQKYQRNCNDFVVIERKSS